MSKRNKKNIFNFVLSVLGCIGVEIYKFFYALGLGIFKFFDIFTTMLFTLFSYIYYGFYYLFKYVYKYIIRIFIKYIIVEIYTIIKECFLGVFYLLKFICYDVPKFFISALSSFFYMLYNKFKHTIEIIQQFFKDLPKKFKEYFMSKFNNLSIVKYYRNKKERELEVLYIDKNSLDAKRSEIKHTYQYLARNKEGKLIKGYFSALSKLDTLSYLLDEGYEVYEIKTNSWIDFIHGENFFLKIRMKNKDLIFWLAQLSTYVKSGVPLTDSVKILAKQNKNKSYKKAFDSIIYELTMGESFSEALRKQGAMFPGLLVNMVKAAEMIGDIETTLDEMSEYYDDMEKNRKAIIGAMTYPTIIFIFAIAVVVFIMIYIIPQFVGVYASMGSELNPYTQAIINISDYLVANWKYLLLGVIGVIIIFKLIYDNLKAFKTAVQYVLMHLPVIGKIMIYNEMTMFSKTFAALTKNNVQLTESIDILSKITNNEIYKMIMFDTISNLLRGDKMSDSFKNNWAVPELAYYMISTGESTGQLAEMLERVADYYQSQQKVTTDQLKTFIEPIMIVMLAVVVGGIVLAIIIPMFEMYGQVV